MIVVTGAAGFIGSCLVSVLNASGESDIIVVDDFTRPEKEANLQGKIFLEKVQRNDFFPWFELNKQKISFIFHLGARTDTTEFNQTILDELNIGFSCRIFDSCAEADIPLIYASSAATYGDGHLGYDDDHHLSETLHPLNLYGESKNEIDKYVLKSSKQPPFWAGMKFFNVFGPNEYHKGRMASVVIHAFRQIKNTGELRLFGSTSPDFKDGEQLRDFIYVKDVTDVLMYFYRNRPNSAIYNLGTGEARSFNDLGKAVFNAMKLPVNIQYIPMPSDLLNKYQNYTRANITKLRQTGYSREFHSLEKAIEDYIGNYLEYGRFL